MKFAIWYMTPAQWRNRAKIDPRNLAATHVHLRNLEYAEELGVDLERIYHDMQGEVWSPNGEARELIKAKGLQHTSMSVGDVIVRNDGDVFMVANCGFECIDREGEEAPGFDDVEAAVEKANDLWAERVYGGK